MTGDVEGVGAYVADKIPRDAVTVMGAAHNEVPALLTAADVGFLILPSARNIVVSSPSKLSEYLNSGLPVLITSSVGDFSSMVANECVGTIVGDNGAFDTSLLDEVVSNRAGIAARCREAGRQLTWPAFSGTWSDIIDRLMSIGRH